MVQNIKEVELYTDGACSHNPGPGGWGAVLIYKGSEKEISGFQDDTTNNKMEIMAVIKGLELLKEKCKVTIYSDSSYVVDSVTKGWVYSWKKNNWIKSDRKQAKNIDLWVRLLELIDKHEITFKKVKGHSDNIYNNRCDELATSEVKKHLKNIT